MRFVWGSIGLLVIGLGLAWYSALRPSANLSHFAQYFVAPNNSSVWQGDSVRVTFFGTSTLLFDDGETQLLIDGFFTRPSVFKVGFGKVSTNQPLVKQVLEEQKINRLKAVFVCHSHYDHVMDAPYICTLTKAILHGSSSTLNVAMGEGLPQNQMQLYYPGQEVEVGKFKVTVIKSKHTPPFRFLGKTNATDPRHPNIEHP